MKTCATPLLWLLGPFEILVRDDIPSKLEIPLTIEIRLSVELIVRKLTRAAVKVLDEAAVLLPRVVTDLLDVAILGEDLAHCVVRELLIGSFENGEQCSLILVTITTLSLVFLTRKRVVDVDGSATKKCALHGQHSITRRSQIVVRNEGDATLVDHIEEGFDLAELLKLLLDELRVGLKLNAADEKGAARLFIVRAATASTCAEATTTTATTTATTTPKPGPRSRRRPWAAVWALRRARSI